MGRCEVWLSSKVRWHKWRDSEVYRSGGVRSGGRARAWRVVLLEPVCFPRDLWFPNETSKTDDFPALCKKYGFRVTSFCICASSVLRPRHTARRPTGASRRSDGVCVSRYKSFPAQPTVAAQRRGSGWAIPIPVSPQSVSGRE